MADEDPQLHEHSSSWAPDVFSDSSLPSAAFEQPLEWPEALPFEPAADQAGPLGLDLDPASQPQPLDLHPESSPMGLDLDLDLDPEPQPRPQADGDDWLRGLQLSPVADTSRADPAALDVDLHLEPLDESPWSPEPEADADEPLVVTSALPPPAFYAVPEPTGPASRRWPGRDDLRHRKGALALASLVGLALVGTLLSVRARNDLSTAQTRRPSGQIAAQGSMNTIAQPTTTATTTAPDPAISLSDLLPLPEDAGAGTEPAAVGGGGDGGGDGGGSAGSASPRAGTPTPTAAPPNRSAAPTGGGGGRTTQPASQPPATTPQPAPTPPRTSPPPDETTETTRRPRDTTPTTVTSSTPTTSQVTRPTWTMPPFPGTNDGD